MAKVLWFSRHPLTEDQQGDLERIYGPVEIIQIDRQIGSAKELATEVASCDVIAVVAPLSLQAEFLQLAGSEKPVVFCKNDRIFENGEKVRFKHVGWFRIREIKTVFEAL